MRKNCQTAVIGAGLMGHGIALTLARAGQYVRITDPTEEARSTLSKRIADSLRTLGESEDRVARILKKIEILGDMRPARLITSTDFDPDMTRLRG